MALGTALVWGGTGPMAKLITATGLSQVSVVCYRAVFVTLVVGVWLWVKRGPSFLFVSRKMLAIYALLGCFLIVFNATGYMMSCVYLSVPRVLMLNYTFPIVTMVGSALLLKEKPTLTQVVAGFMVLLGLYFGFLSGRGEAGPFSWVGVAWAALSVVGLSGQALLVRGVLKSGLSDPLLQLFYSHLFGGIFLIAAKSLLMGWADWSVMNPRLFALINYPAVMSALLGYGLMFSALQYIPAPLVSLLCTTEIVFALILTPLIIHQPPSFNELVGCAIILAAVACSIVRPKNSRS